ncbi:MAG: arylsulfatase [Planctomycetota bacterium]
MTRTTGRPWRSPYVGSISARVRPALVLVAALSALVFLGPAMETGPPPRLNVLLVVTDDQGLGDFGVSGNPVLRTPRLDAFAAECPTVERFYVSPVCSPTRASLMTGRYSYRTRVVDTYRGRSMMDPSEETLAEILSDDGYRTGIFGKWHLGDAFPLRAVDQGFDTSLVHRGGGLAQPSEPPENEGRYTDPLLRRDGREWARANGYSTQVFVDEALSFIDSCADAGEPFFAYVATNAPHGPFDDVPDDLYQRYLKRDLTDVLTSDGTNPDVVARTYAMIEDIDRGFGRLLDRLEKRKLDRNTLVIFLTDNGPVQGRWNADLRGGKTTVYEGGIRSPLWMRWPRRLSPETTVDRIAAHIDILPTVLEATGTPLPDGIALDGRSLLPLLEARDEPWPERQVVVQAHRGDTPERDHNCALVGERWKLVRASGFGSSRADPNVAWQLFDLMADPGETTNLFAEETDRVIAMRADYERWYSDVATTRFDNFGPPRIRPATSNEPVTTLTRQDWRADSGTGWGTRGRWFLHFDDETDYELRLRFREARTLDRVLVAIDQRIHDFEVGATAASIPVGPIRIPAGHATLQVECVADGESFDPYQIEVVRVIGEG